MEIEIKPLHYGHCTGFTDVTYSADGEKLISCGNDGDVRVWNGFDDADPFQTALGEFVLCTKQKNDHLIVCTDFKVQLLEFPSCERVGMLTRLPAQGNHIAVSNSHNWLAIGSDDMTIKAINLDTKALKSMPPMKGPILSVAIDNLHQHIAAACGDGTLKIVNIDKEVVIKEWQVVQKANCFESSDGLCRIDFDSQNKYLAYPDDTKVVLINVDDWSEAGKLSSPFDGPFSIVTFSPSANYLAATTLDGDICVWNVQTRTLTGTLLHPNGTIITAICWNPKENGELAFSDVEGYIGLAVNCCNTASRHVTDDNESETINDGQSSLDGIDDDNKSDADINDEFAAAFSDDDDDNENAISLEKLKRDVMGTDDAAEDEGVRSPSPRPRSRTLEPPLQQGFMPSSTPEHLDPRYMCWNDIGVVRCYGSSLEEDEEGARSIEVEFHDSTVHHSMMMANYHGFTMGSISSAALAVANSSFVNVVPLRSAGKEWSLKAPEEDVEIVSLAASKNFICFGTNKYQMHVCTIHGIQKAVFSVPGPIICTSAFDYVVMVAYHAGNWRKTDPNIEIMVVKLEGRATETKYLKSALGPDATLQWLGFTDLGRPAMMDSNGVVCVQSLSSDIWLPFCNTKKELRSPSDGFFVTAISESSQTVRGVKCKGSVYPPLTPVPMVSELTLAPPFWNMDTEKHQLEANLCTWTTLEVEDITKKFKETALRAFAISAKNNYQQRALELIDTLRDHTVLSLAMRYVSKLGKTRLGEKLRELESRLDIAAGEVDEIDATMPSICLKARQKLVLSSDGKVFRRSKLVSRPTNAPLVDPEMPKNIPVITQDTLATPLSLLTQRNATVTGDEPKNPFLISLKKSKPEGYNPLSLTDKFAGLIEAKEREKENKAEASTSSDKRKLSDTSPAEKSKQRKLDNFMFKRP